MNNGPARRAKRRWNDEHNECTCRDHVIVTLQHKVVTVRDLDEQKTVPRSGIRYARDTQTHALLPRIDVSGVEFDRGMKIVFGASDSISTMIFPTTVRTIR